MIRCQKRNRSFSGRANGAGDDIAVSGSRSNGTNSIPLSIRSTPGFN